MNLLKSLITLLILLVVTPSLFALPISKVSSSHGEQTAPGSVSTGSSDLELLHDGDIQQVGVFFSNIAIPQGSTISSAYLQFQVDETTTNRSTNVVIYGDNVDSAVNYSSQDVYTRTVTASSASWAIPDWDNVGDNGVAQQSPELKTIIQELVNRGGWNSGNNIALLIKAGPGCVDHDCRRTAENNPTLFINYTDNTSPLTANDDTYETPVDTSKILAVLDNDTAGPGETFDTLSITTSPTNGSVTVNADNTITYTPNAGYQGTDTFFYRVTNSAAETSNEATVVITVGTLTCITYDIPVDAANSCGTVIDVLDGQSPTIATCIYGISENGGANSPDFYKFSVAEYGILKITTSSPNSHPYHLAIGSTCGGEQHYADSTAQNHSVDEIYLAPGETVHIYVKETGSGDDEYQLNFLYKPMGFRAIDDEFDTNPDTNGTFDILANDSPGEGFTIDTTSVTITSAPTHGIYVLNADGTVSYQPNSGYVGNDTFTYTVQNSNGETSNEATVTIFVGYPSGDRDFTVRNPEDTRNLRGNYQVGGNMNLCEETSTGSGVCRTDNSNSNSRSDMYIDIDGDPSTKNSSSFDLNLPANSTVVWAGLYWQGVVHRSSEDTKGDVNTNFMGGNIPDTAPKVRSSSVGLDLSVNTYGAEIVKFKIPGGSYVEVNADQLDYSNLGYGGYADVTSMLNPTNPNGTYFLADVKAHEGSEPNHGNYAGWSIVVIYKNLEEKYRNITLFDGFATIDSGYGNDLTIDGFLTPKTTPVQSKIAFFTMDGEGGTNSLTIISETNGASLVSGPGNPGNRLFNSTIIGVNNRQPNYPSLRLDLDDINITDALAPLETQAILQPRTTGDRYTASYFMMSSELYIPRFCYDYAYKQGGLSFTEDNSDGHFPKIKGTVTIGDPIEVSIYLRNQEDSEFSAKNMKLEITDINTTQAIYYRGEDGLGSVQLTPINSIIKAPILDSALDVSDDYVKDVLIGDVNNLDYFYMYYSLDPKVTNIDFELKATVYYNLSILLPDNTVFNAPNLYNSTLSEEITMCSSSNFKYLPAFDKFNIEHADLFTLQKYNLPTQVARRADRFKVVSYDVNETVSNTNIRKDFNGTVFVELIDAGRFHDVNASCHEPSSAISPRIQVRFNSINNSNFNADTITNYNIGTHITADEFWKNANQNTAFRLSYNAIGEDEEMVQVEPVSGGGWIIKNYTELESAVVNINTDLGLSPHNRCRIPFEGSYHSGGVLITNTYNTMLESCGSTADTIPITDEELAICMECVYGYNIRYTCSRDNFAIRPEAFNIQISDQKQTNLSLTKRIEENHTGIDAIVPDRTHRVIDGLLIDTDIVEMAAGYNYLLDINATNNIDNNNTPGYKRYFGTHNDEYNLTTTWIEDSNLTCNDVNLTTHTLDVLNGGVAYTKFINNQVGKYTLKMIDKTWTRVDWDNSVQTHQDDATYYTLGTDCALDTTLVPETNESMTTDGIDLINSVGCVISSEHNHTLVDKHLTYKNYQLQFHPYELNVDNLEFSHGPDFNTTFEDNTFIYISDLNIESNMSLNTSGNIIAKGYNGVQLSNYTTNCYANDLNISLHKEIVVEDANDSNVFGTTFYSDNENSGSNILYKENNNSFNQTQVTSEKIVFTQDTNGSMQLRLHYNYDRNTTALNAKRLSVKDISVHCLDTTECTMYADLNSSYENNRSVNLDKNVTFMYGRTTNVRQEYPCPSFPCSEKATVQFLVFSDNNTSKSILPNGSISIKYGTEDNWYENTKHNPGNTLAIIDGIAGVITPANNLGYTFTRSSTTDENPSYASMTYSGPQLPAQTRIEYRSSSWLLYDAVAGKNFHQFIYQGRGGEWTGNRATSQHTDDEATVKTNQRIFW